MLVDVNLLPRKEKKKSPFLFLVLVAVLIVAAGGGFLLLSYNQQLEVANRLEEQLVTVQGLREVLQQNEAENASSSAQVQLETAIDWAENYPTSTFTLLRHLSYLLPERGFVLALSYQDNGSAQLSVQFDSSREAAYYLTNLQNSELVKEARLSTINTENVEGETATEEATDEILPRYIGQYSLVIDRNAVKEAYQEEEGDS